MRETIGHMSPAVLCAFICVLALVRWAGSEATGLSPVFFAFLPVCFVMLGFLTARLQREVGELRRRLQDLETRRS
jgi:hypothetical protein